MSGEPTPVQKERVLITVLTYPHPSTRHNELVCTAGIAENRDWVRLYPIDYRYRPKHQQFRKYQWIELEMEACGAGNDKRKESRKPKLDTIKILGDPLPTTDNWRARTQIINQLPHSTIKQLKASYEEDQTSLGIIRPSSILDVEIEEIGREWKGSWLDVQNQLLLFDPQPKKLTKLPFKWSYVFTCDDNAEPYKLMIEDWELGALFLKVRESYDEKKAAEIVRDKYLIQLASPDRDLRFFMGTFFPYNTWLIIGVFWPPKSLQGELF